MKKGLQLLIGMMLTLQLPAQNFTGQWKGEFIDRVFVRGRTFPAIEVTRCLGNQVAKQIGVISEPDVLSYKITS